MALSSRAAVALDARAVRARGLALWVTESDSELNARTTLTRVSHGSQIASKYCQRKFNKTIPRRIQPTIPCHIVVYPLRQSHKSPPTLDVAGCWKATATVSQLRRHPRIRDQVVGQIRPSRAMCLVASLSWRWEKSHILLVNLRQDAIGGKRSILSQATASETKLGQRCQVMRIIYTADEHTRRLHMRPWFG